MNKNTETLKFLTEQENEKWIFEYSIDKDIEQNITIVRSYKYNPKDDLFHYGELILSNYILDKVNLYSGVVDQDGNFDLNNKICDVFTVSNPFHWKSYESYNSITVDEIVLCIVNSGEDYRNIERIIKEFKKDLYKDKWLQLELENYFRIAIARYARENLDKVSDFKNIITGHDLIQIKKEIIGYYSMDGENDLINGELKGKILNLFTGRGNKNEF